MGGRRSDLEVLVPQADAGGSPPPDAGPGAGPTRGPPWRRRLLLAVGLAVVAGAVALPLRDRIARSELRWLERQWAQSIAEDTERTAAEQRLNAYRFYGDRDTVNNALAALYREEAHRFDTVRSRLGRAVLVDLGVARVRADLVAAVAHRGRLLAGVATYYGGPITAPSPPDTDDQTSADTRRVSADIAAARGRWREQRPFPSVRAAHYGAEAAARARLSRWLDQPTGTVLMAEAGGTAVRLDVDASTVTATPVTPVESAGLVMRRGYLAYSSAGRIWAVAPDGSGPARLLGTGMSLFPADDPTAIWIVDGPSFAATEVDGTGHVLQGVAATPGFPVAATSGALLETVEPTGDGRALPPLLVWSLADHRVQCRLSVPGGAGLGAAVLATHGNLFAWVDGAHGVHVTDATSCAEPLHRAAVVADPRSPGPFVAAFSPNGRTLAVGSDGGTEALLLVTLDPSLDSARAVKVIAETLFPVDALTWTSDGARLFWLAGTPVAGATLLGTWKVGDQQGRTLRTPRLVISPPLLAVP